MSSITQSADLSETDTSSHLNFGAMAFYKDARAEGDSRREAFRRTVDVRGKVGWALSSVSHRLARLGNRLCEDVPCDYWESWEDGRAYGQRRADHLSPRIGPAFARVREAMGVSVEDMATIAGLAHERLAEFEGGGAITAAEYDALTIASSNYMAGAR